MRLRSVVGLALASLLVLATGGPASFAQNDADGSRYLHLDRAYRSPGYAPPAYGGRYQAQPYGYRYEPGPYYRNPYQAPPRSYERARRPQPGTRQEAVAPPPSGGFFFPFFRPVPEPGYREPERAVPSGEPYRRRAAPRAAPSRPREAAPQPEKKNDPSTIILVVGDSLADLVGQGLEHTFADNTDVAVVRKTRGDSGLVRSDYHDWPKAIEELLNGGQKASYAVMLLGANDRQAIREGEFVHDPFSDRWRELYRERVDAVVRAFGSRNIPVLWIGAPPVKNDRLSTDLIALNEIYRDRVQRAGGVYVDIWEAFVNDENRYSPVGPDVDGQVARLRTTDGVHFTRAGARKAAHFADVELKRLMEARAAGVAATPTNPAATAAPAVPAIADPAAGERPTSVGLPTAPTSAVVPAPAARPAVGPVLPLTRVDVSPGGALASGRQRLEGDAAHVVERALRDGVAPPPLPGRADDFTWPKQ